MNEMEEDEPTPRPRKKGNQTLEISSDDDNEPFQSPLTLKSSKRIIFDSADEGTRKAVKGNTVQSGEMAGVGKKKKTKGDNASHQTISNRFPLIPLFHFRGM